MMSARWLGLPLMRNVLRLSGAVATRNLSTKFSPRVCEPVLSTFPTVHLPKQSVQINNYRFLSSSEKSDYVSKDITIADVMNGVLEKYLVLIDVREPHELQETGKIGHAINIPVSEIEKAFSMSDEEFKAKYHIYKPNIMSERVVIYCKTGKRALKVCEALHKMGYDKIKRYPGGIKEWTEILFGQSFEEKTKK